MTWHRWCQRTAIALIIGASVACHGDATSAGSIVLSTSAASFVPTDGGGNPPSQTISVTGAGEPGVLSVGTIQYSGASGWLAASLSTSTVPSVLTLNVNVAGLGIGTFTGVVPVNALNAATQSVTVTLTVTTALPAKLELQVAPGGALSGQLLATQPVVLIVDTANALVPKATTPVTVTVNGATGITVSGTTTRNAVNGVVTFTDLRVTGSGTFALTFASPGVIPVTSSILTVTALPGSVSFGTTQALLAVSGTFSTSAVVRDGGNTVITGLPLTYTSRSPSVALVGSTGTISGVSAGQAIIVVSVTGTPALQDSLMAVVTAPGAPLLISNLTAFSLPHDTTITVAISVNMGTSTNKLASATIGISWNAVQLAFQSSAPGATVTPAINASASTGTALVSFANSTGFSGTVEVVKLTFKVTSLAGLTGTFALSATEMTAADGTDLTTNLVAVSQPVIVH